MTARSFRLVALGLGFAFLYGPIFWIVAFSFNEGRLVTLWSGFSTKWYGELARNRRLVDAALFSLVVAAVSASLATLLGALAGFALSRLGRFRGRGLLAGALGAVLTLPEVILGLALLLAFVSIDAWLGGPGRGAWTIVVAHATLGMAYVTLVVRARLAGFDRSLEEAALDLGATPAGVFLHVTLPLILPALGGGWLIAFMLSLDDVVLASFVAGPGATTLPMVVFSSARLGLNPQINALATIMVGIGALAVLIAVWLLGRQERQR
ncbi:MAG: ABC transporter permease subunit [Alphaproteobacteria bacterium]|nr:ABC transporter permease subunit [Alphaproteobacteria bacterium]